MVQSSPKESGTISVYVDTAAWFMRPNNTDWRYVTFILPRLPEFVDGVRMHVQHSAREVVARNLRFLAWRLRGKLGCGVIPQDWVSGGVTAVSCCARSARLCSPIQVFR